MERRVQSQGTGGKRRVATAQPQNRATLQAFSSPVDQSVAPQRVASSNAFLELTDSLKGLNSDLQGYFDEAFERKLKEVNEMLGKNN